VVELARRDLKEGSGLEHCPSGDFNANAAWAVLASIAHNLVCWIGALGLEIIGPLVATTIRRYDASSTRCLVELHSPLDDATFTRPRSGPGPSSAANASADSSNCRPSHFGFEVARGTPGDFQREESQTSSKL
jgi:hypothetical protein